MMQYYFSLVQILELINISCGRYIYLYNVFIVPIDPAMA